MVAPLLSKMKPALSMLLVPLIMNPEKRFVGVFFLLLWILSFILVFFFCVHNLQFLFESFCFRFDIFFKVYGLFICSL